MNGLNELEDPIDIVMWSLWTLWLEGLFTESENDPEGDEPEDKPLYQFASGQGSIGIEHQCMDMAADEFGRVDTLKHFPQWVRDEACKWIGAIEHSLNRTTAVINYHVKEANENKHKAVVDFWFYSVWQAVGHGVCFVDNWEMPELFSDWQVPSNEPMADVWGQHVSELLPLEVLADYQEERK